MKSRLTRFLLFPGALALVMCLLSSTPFAGSDEIIGKKVDIRFLSTVFVNNQELKPRLYQLQHIAEDGDHFIVFRKVLTGGRTKEATRAKCKLVPLIEKVKNTRYRFEGDALAEVSLKGEMFKHVFIVNS